jgi:hypothetical protein
MTPTTTHAIDEVIEDTCLCRLRRAHRQRIPQVLGLGRDAADVHFVGTHGVYCRQATILSLDTPTSPTGADRSLRG